ncbi:hypothetical protein ABFT80_22900 [Mesorhizobium sp. SB112]|uniref:hypothetical protein n=1 Tax=Mesorhizobium sp. SB112 TaxID=3151853 RepID=UPI003267F9EF
MDRSATLTSLIRFDAPLADLEARLQALSWDSSPVVTLQREHIIAVLQRFLSGELDAGAVETWANLVEGREDIRDEPGREEVTLAAIHDLANPVLQGRLEDIASEVLANLRLD